MHENGEYAKSGICTRDRERQDGDSPVRTTRAEHELASVASADTLEQRPRHPADLVAENHAMAALAQSMTASPEIVLQKVADTALALCDAHSAGICLVEETRINRWLAIVGQWAPYRGKSAPPFSPCGMVVSSGVPLLFSHPERDFPCLERFTPAMDEGLSIPFFVNGEAVGTIWVISHDQNRRFNAEHLRTMTNLSAFAAAAYKGMQSVDATSSAGQTPRQTSQALRYLAAAVESCDDAIITCDLDGIVTTWNTGAERLFGYTAGQAIGEPAKPLIAPDCEDFDTNLQRVRVGEHSDIETIRHRKGGDTIDVALTVSPIRDAAGRVVGMSKIARDNSARRAALEQQALLIREMSHRVRNLFSVAAAVVALSARFAASPQNLAQAVEERFAALGRALDLIWPGPDGSAGRASRDTMLHALARIVFAPFVDRTVSRERLVLVGQDVAIGSQAATNVALVLHELATNSAKYGALSSAHGVVHVQCSVKGDALLLTWAEHGGPPIGEAPVVGGFGDMLIHGIVHDTFGGHVTRDWRRDGLTVRLSVPMHILQS